MSRSLIVAVGGTGQMVLHYYVQLFQIGAMKHAFHAVVVDSAALRAGLGRIAFVHKRYADAEHWYGHVLGQFGNSHFAPEAMYWRAVAQYKATNDHTVLGNVAEELRSAYPSSVWATKAIPWLHWRIAPFSISRRWRAHANCRTRTGASERQTSECMKSDRASASVSPGNP